MNRDYRIVTVCNRMPREPYYCLREWVMSLKDARPLVLGTQPNEYGGLGSKPRLLYKAIKDGAIPQKYTIFCDCFDLVFSEHPDGLFDYYKRNDYKPLVISAEKNCFPSDLKDEYDKLDNLESPYKYLNSGMIIGETEALLTALESMDAPNIPNDYFDEEKQIQVNPNDQFYWQQTFLKQPVPMELDYEQILCNTLHSVKLEELRFDEDGIFNIETNSYPFSFHLNGSAKTDGLREPILKHLKLI